MPAPNDLTPEEEAMFIEGGMAPLGEGGEPVREGQEETPPAQPGQEQPGQETPPVQPGQEQPGQETPPQPRPGEPGSRQRADGTFKSKEELEADAATLAAATPTGQQQQQEPTMVPLAALHEARQRSAQAQRQAQLAMTRLNAILSQQQQQNPNQVQMPDITQDPAGFLLALDQRLTQFEQQRQQESQYREVDSGLEQDELLFSQQVPDYDQASDYYVNSRARELLQFHTPEQAQQILTQEARAIAQQSWQRGQSAAQVVYGLAQARGYQPGQQSAQQFHDVQQFQQQQQPGQQQQIPPQLGQQQQRPANAQAQVAAVAAAQAASRSLSGGTGSAAPEVVNAEALLAMSDEEFEAHLKLGEKGANARFANAL